MFSTKFYITMIITYFTEEATMPTIEEELIKIWIDKVAAKYGRKVGELSYIFCSDNKILEVNKQYLKHDYYTDIITFDYCKGKIISGDLFISLDTVRSNSDKFKTPYNQELHRTIIHGVLHLCGINDKGPGEREIMENEENEALAIYKELDATF